MVLLHNITILLYFPFTVTSEANPMSSRHTLCGTNGVTYPSLCHLIQDTGNEGVAYAGACNSDKCNSGNVSAMRNVIPDHAWQCKII